MLSKNLTAEPTERADVWRVPSETTPGAVYTVTVEDVGARAPLETTCSCKAGQAKRGCKHQLLVCQEFNRSTRHGIALLKLQDERKAVAA